MIISKRVLHGKHDTLLLKRTLYLLVSFALVGGAQLDWSLCACMGAACGGFALFAWGLEGFSKKKIFFISLIWMSGIQLIQQSWIASSDYTGPIVFLGWFLHAISYGGVFGLWMQGVYASLSVLEIVALSGGWVALEALRPWLFFGLGFAWNPVGLMLTGVLPSLHFASVSGMAGLSFWVMLGNLAVYRWKGLGLIVASVPYIVGGGLLLKHSTEKPQKVMEAILVQQAHGPWEAAPEVWSNLCELLMEHMDRSYDLIMISEGGVPYDAQLAYIPALAAKNLFKNWLTDQWDKEEMLTNMDLLKMLNHISGNPLLVGMCDNQREGGYFNSAFYIHDSQQVNCYHKRWLVPFGEYLPWCFRWAKNFMPCDVGFARGNNTMVFDNGFRFAPAICYEETISQLNRKSRQAGAEVLVGLTNDVWYPFSRLPLSHFHHARVRTVELGMPMLRVCNTGVSCAIDSLGRTIAMLPYETRDRKAVSGVLSVQLPISNYSTWYLRWGNTWLIVITGFAILFLALKRVIR